MSSTLCVTVRTGLSTLHVNCRQSSMWSAVLQCPVSTHSVPHRQVKPGGCTHASLQIFSDNCVHYKPWILLIAAKDSRWERVLFLTSPHSTFCDAKQRNRSYHPHLRRCRLFISAESSQTGKDFKLLCFVFSPQSYTLVLSHVKLPIIKFALSTINAL